MPVDDEDPVPGSSRSAGSDGHGMPSPYRRVLPRQQHELIPTSVISQRGSHRDLRQGSGPQAMRSVHITWLMAARRTQLWRAARRPRCQRTNSSVVSVSSWT